MDLLSTWCRMLAFISVLSGVVNFLIPDGSVKKVYKTLCTAVLVFSLVSALGRTDIKSAVKMFDKSKTQIAVEDRYNSYIEDQLLSLAEKEIENLILSETSELTEKGNIEVRCYASQNESIAVKVKIKGNFSSVEKDELVKRITAVTGGETELIFEGDNAYEGEK